MKKWKTKFEAIRSKKYNGELPDHLVMVVELSEAEAVLKDEHERFLAAWEAFAKQLSDKRVLEAALAEARKQECICAGQCRYQPTRGR